MSLLNKKDGATMYYRIFSTEEKAENAKRSVPDSPYVYAVIHETEME